MKKYLILVLACFLLLFSLAACASSDDGAPDGTTPDSPTDSAQPPADSATDPADGSTNPADGSANPGDGSADPADHAAGTPLSCKIAAVLGDSLLLAEMGDSGQELLFLLPHTGLVLADAAGAAIEASALRAGMLVDISYSGAIMESYPAQIGSPTALTVTAAEDDLVGFYLRLVQDIYEEDEGLNDGISLLALDLTAAENLNAAEKGALLYLAQETFADLSLLQATFEELELEGLISGEFPQFETGLLISFSEMSFATDSFTFTLEKWRSALGAYFYQDCQAQKAQDGSWDYTVGSHAIS